MSKALERRAKLREALIEAAERALAAKGLGGLRTRDLADEIGIAKAICLSEGGSVNVAGSSPAEEIADGVEIILRLIAIIVARMECSRAYGILDCVDDNGRDSDERRRPARPRWRESGRLQCQGTSA